MNMACKKWAQAHFLFHKPPLPQRIDLHSYHDIQETEEEP